MKMCELIRIFINSSIILKIKLKKIIYSYLKSENKIKNA